MIVGDCAFVSWGLPFRDKGLDFRFSEGVNFDATGACQKEASFVFCSRYGVRFVSFSGRKFYPFPFILGRRGVLYGI